MDREVVLALLTLVLGGLAAEAMGWWPAAVEDRSCSGRRLERIAWSGIWKPLVPAGLMLAALGGWAVVEPAEAEALPRCFVLGALPFAALLVRAALRAVRSLRWDERGVPAATVGLLRPRLVLSPRLTTVLDPRALEAVREHEKAHARHRDPLRLWLAQLGTDLQWPWPAARRRFRGWLMTLEFARDEEARARGIDGADLATAVLVAARLGSSSMQPLAARVTGDGGGLQARVARLLAPLPAEEPSAAPRRWLLMLALLVAGVLGAVFGEALVAAVTGGTRPLL